MNLATLPSDIIRKVIRLELNSIANMQLISPLWNTLALEHLNNRKHLPIIECVRWFMHENGQDILGINIPKTLRRYFGASKWKLKYQFWLLHRSNDSLVWLMNEDVDRGCPEKILTRNLQRCCRIKQMEINMISEKFERPMETVSRALRGETIIEELSIKNVEYFHPSVLNSILHSVRNGWVQRVVFLSPSSAYIDNINDRHFKAHYEFVLNVSKFLGRIDMAYIDLFSQQRQPSFDAYWGLKRATLSTQFKIEVTMEIENISADTNHVRFVLKA